MTRQLAPQLAAGKQKQRIVARAVTPAVTPAVTRRTPETGPRRAPAALALQRSIGNRAVTRLVQGTPRGGFAPLLIQRNPAQDLIANHTAVGVVDRAALAQALGQQIQAGNHAIVPQVFTELAQADREAVADEMARVVRGTRPPLQRNLTLEEGKQGKHIVGHPNYEQEKNRGNFKSILDVDANVLAKFVGTGQSVGGRPPNDPNYRERIDFGFVIGRYVETDPATRKPIESPTTKAIVHFSQKGIHFVPANP